MNTIEPPGKERKPIWPWVALGAFLTYVGANKVAEKAKNLVFGKDRNPWRKAVFYTSIAGAIIYKTQGDKIIDAAGKAREWYDARKAAAEEEKVRTLEDALRDANNTINGLYGKIDSLQIFAEETGLDARTQIEHNRRELELYTRQADSLRFEIRLRDEVKEIYTEFLKEKNAPVSMSTPLREPASNPEPARRESPPWYMVRPGDTLSEIAQQYLGSINKYHEIARLNNINDPSNIDIGQVLRMDLPGLQTTTGLNYDERPRFYAIKNRGESLENFLTRSTGVRRKSRLREFAQEVIMYNESIGNSAAITNRNARQVRIYLPAGD